MSIVRKLCLAGVLIGLAGCGTGSDPQPTNATWTAADEATLDAEPAQVCTPGQPDPRACDPSDTKKTTVCHIPPGNPANEHTICVGNAAVPAHMAHGDHLGSCCGNDGGGDVDGGTVGNPTGGGGATGAGPIG